MGGADTVNTLYLKDADTVRKACRKVIANGIQILAPGCAVAPATPFENLRAMVEVARAHQPAPDM
jgi:[methyl-Co(III) methanol-specific corrinoid protein]:coenzyme M methyltransferase